MNEERIVSEELRAEEKAVLASLLRKLADTPRRMEAEPENEHTEPAPAPSPEDCIREEGTEDAPHD